MGCLLPTGHAHDGCGTCSRDEGYVSRATSERLPVSRKLAYPSILLEVHCAEIPQGRVPACRVVDALDIIEHIGLCLVPRPVGFTPESVAGFVGIRTYPRPAAAPQH